MVYSSINLFQRQDLTPIGQVSHLFRTLMASIAPKTPTTPSYFPEYGIASIWEPVATAARSGSSPSLNTKVRWGLVKDTETAITKIKLLHQEITLVDFKVQWIVTLRNKSSKDSSITFINCINGYILRKSLGKD